MYKVLPKIGFFISCLLLCQLTFAQDIQFRNFDKIITLLKIDGDTYLLDNKIQVKVTNRVVVKAENRLNRDALLRADKRVTDVTKLYISNNYTYYLLSFNDPDNLKSILRLSADLPMVKNVQPDLLQLRSKEAFPAGMNPAANYIEELNIKELWDTTKGENARIAIIDDGFDLNHPDLRGVNLMFGYDVETNTLDPSPKSPLDIHGTRIAGIIFARHNGIGIDGIAPDAQLIAVRHADTWTSKMLLSFYLAKTAGADVVNCSWNSRILLEPVADVINDLTTSARNNLGAAVVFAAGNKGKPVEKGGSEASLPDVITVGSADDGKRLPFSNYGENVDVYTYGKNILTVRVHRQ